MADADPREIVNVAHPEIEGVAQMTRTHLARAESSGWREVKDTERAGKPTARRAAAAKVAAAETPATATSEPSTVTADTQES